jgi:RNA polymerase sigma-70 factor, ECF subfamily
MDKSDTVLIANAQKKPSDFSFLYKKYVSAIFNYFWYRVGHDKDVTEDLTQETFVRAYKHIQNYVDQGYSYKIYLMTIARRVLIDYYRKPTTEPLDEIGDIPDEVLSNIERKDDAKTLWRALQTLPQKQRDILLMFYQDEKSIKEISHITGMSENAVKLNLSRTRKKLFEHPYLQDMKYFAHKKRQNKTARYTSS